MGDRMKYNHAAIGAASGDLKARSTQIDTILNDLKSDLQKLDQGWNGEGAEAYRTLKGQWDQAAAGLNATLLKVSQVVQSGNEAMQASDKSAGRAFGG